MRECVRTDEELHQAAGSGAASWPCQLCRVAECTVQRATETWKGVGCCMDSQNRDLLSLLGVAAGLASGWFLEVPWGSGENCAVLLCPVTPELGPEPALTLRPSP